LHVRKRFIRRRTARTLIDRTVNMWGSGTKNAKNKE
jgi:hypothetical protein